ncbi:MAG: prephenate dehydrogenase/arogenate dehydrogenase family protein [Rickettsiales bacterium]|nr:prephenate dehydrogenase/arogenate dehydrogenase family protein [Rickettsiales bacterium]
MITLFDNSLIFGLGLIGGSFAKALRDKNISTNIFAFDKDEETINKALDDGLIKGSLNDVKEEIDFVVIAVPLSSYKQCFDIISHLDLANNALIIDLGSLKKFVLGQIPDNLKDKFIGCHPIAGSHSSGYDFCDGELFKDKDFVVCRNNFLADERWNKITKLTDLIESRMIILDEAKHDEIFCLTSHLPQFLSFMTKEFSPKDIKDEFFKNVFRLDSSNTSIWDDIFKLNQNNLEKSYITFFDELENNIQALYEDKLNLDLNLNYKIVNFDSKFLEDNFAAIFLRFLMVKSYLKIIPNEHHKFTGSGFKDFTSVISILSDNNIEDLIKNNKAKILELFDKIS